MTLRFDRRAADAGEGLVRGLALHERDVEPALLEQRDVLGAALGVLRLDDERGVGLPDGLDEGRPVDREAAAGRRGAEREAGLLGHGGGFQVGLGHRGSDRHDGENHRYNDNAARSDHHQNRRR